MGLEVLAACRAVATHTIEGNQMPDTTARHTRCINYRPRINRWPYTTTADVTLRQTLTAKTPQNAVERATSSDSREKLTDMRDSPSAWRSEPHFGASAGDAPRQAGNVPRNSIHWVTSAVVV